MNDTFACAIIRQLKRLNRHPDTLTPSQVRRIIFNTVDSCACGGSLRLLRASVVCRQCKRRRDLRACTVLHRKKIDFHHVIRAVWYVRMSWQPISARGFSRRYALRQASAWALLHQVRGSIPRISMWGKTFRAQVLGFRSPNNTAFVVGGPGPHGIWLDTDDNAVPGGDTATETPLSFGRFRAWLVDCFCGVTARYLDNYLAEWSERRTTGALNAAP